MTVDPHNDPDLYTRPDFRSAALITIDTQRDVLDGAPFAIPGTTAVLPRMRELLAAFRAADHPIVHVVRLYERSGANVDLCRRRAVEGGLRVLAPGDAGSELPVELLPDPTVRLDAQLLLAGGLQPLGPNEVALFKPRWGAFYDTHLESHLRQRAVSTLVFTGCNFPNCPRTSIYEASERDFRVVLVRDAVSGVYERGERELRGIGVHVLDTVHVLDEFESALASPASSL